MRHNAVLSCRAPLPDFVPRGPSPNHVWLPLRGQLQHNVTCHLPESIGPPVRSVFWLGGCAGVMLATRRGCCASSPRRVFPRKAAGAARWALRLSLRTESVFPDSRQIVLALRFLFSCRQGPPRTVHRPARRSRRAYDSRILMKLESHRQGFPV